MRYMKGFIFTLDGIFALVIAGFAIAIVVYVHYISLPSYAGSQGASHSLLMSMLQENLSALTQAPPNNLYAPALASAAGSWPEAGGGSAQNYSSPSPGPSAPRLLFSYNAPSLIAAPLVAGDGFIVFTAANVVYLLNSTTGAPYTTIDTLTTASAPLIYLHRLLFYNSSNQLDAYTESGTEAWSANLPTQPNTPLALLGRSIGFAAGNTLYLLNAQNGTTVANVALAGPLQTPSYGSGMIIAITNNTATQNYIYSYTLAGNALVRNWEYTIPTTGVTTAAALAGGHIVFGAGPVLYVLSLGGNELATGTLDSRIAGSPSVAGSAIYAYTTDRVYHLSLQGAALASVYAPAPANTKAAPLSTSNGALYLDSDGIFQAYSLSALATLWSVPLPASGAQQSPGAAVTLAGGNAYLSYGDSLYAFGSCSAPGGSLLGALASMYLNGEATCAQLFLNRTYPGQPIAIYLNQSYAPSISTAAFNSSANETHILDDYARTNSLSANGFTLSLWISPMEPTLDPDAPQGLVNMLPHMPAGLSLNYTTPFNSVSFEWEALPALYALANTTPGQWYNIVVLWNQSGGYDSIYVNGTLADTVNGISPTPITATASLPLLLGSAIDGAGHYRSFNGALTDIQFYNDTFSPQQVGSLFASGPAGLPLNYSTLAGWWPLDGDANDYSSAHSLSVPTNLTFNATRFTPASLPAASQVSRSSTVMGVAVGAMTRNLSVGVVAWH